MFFRAIFSAVETVLTEAIKQNKTLLYNKFRLLATDAWDITEIENERVAEFLKGRHFVVIPRTHQSENRTANIKQHMASISPRTSRLCFLNSTKHFTFTLGNNIFQKSLGPLSLEGQIWMQK